jgi:hypothetical protein
MTQWTFALTSTVSKICPKFSSEWVQFSHMSWRVVLLSRSRWICAEYVLLLLKLVHDRACTCSAEYKTRQPAQRAETWVLNSTWIFERYSEDCTWAIRECVCATWDTQTSELEAPGFSSTDLSRHFMHEDSLSKRIILVIRGDFLEKWNSQDVRQQSVRRHLKRHFLLFCVHASFTQ